MNKKALDEKYSYQIDENNVIHLFRGEEDCQQLLTNPLLSAIFKIESLEKENAELKEKQKWLGSSTKCWFSNSPCRSCDEHDERLRRLGLCYIGQLTEAKKLIKKLYSHVFQGMDFMELNDFNVLKTEAENFLSEVEK